MRRGRRWWSRAIWFGVDGVGLREEGAVLACSEDRAGGEQGSMLRLSGRYGRTFTEEAVAAVGRALWT